MAATVVVQEVTGAKGSKTFTTISNRVRLFTADQATDQGTPQITYPVPIHASGVGNFYYSYWKHVCLGITGTFTKIDNIRHYSDGAIGWNYGTGGQLRRGNRDSGDIGVGVDTDNSHSDDYEQAAGTQGTTGYTIENVSNGHDFYNTQTTPTANIASDLVGAPAVIDSAGETAAGKSKAVLLQVKVDGDATSGVQTAETLTWKYDIIE
jgi:hypothetical protein